MNRISRAWNTHDLPPPDVLWEQYRLPTGDVQEFRYGDPVSRGILSWIRRYVPWI